MSSKNCLVCKKDSKVLLDSLRELDTKFISIKAHDYSIVYNKITAFVSSPTVIIKCKTTDNKNIVIECLSEDVKQINQIINPMQSVLKENAKSIGLLGCLLVVLGLSVILENNGIEQINNLALMSSSVLGTLSVGAYFQH